MVWFTIIYSAIFSLLMAGLGYLFTRRPPKHINPWYGYRTPRSMKNEATWDFAHRYAGRVWIRCGLLNAGVSAVFLALFGRLPEFEYAVLVLLAVQLMILLAVIPITERALRQRFDKDGNPRQPGD